MRSMDEDGLAGNIGPVRESEMARSRPALSLTSSAGLTRRAFLASLLAAAGSAACQRSTSPLSLVGVGAPPDFPADITLYAEDYENWTREFSVPQLSTFAPRVPDEVVRVANWAAANGKRLRARGMRHAWSPLTITANTTATSGLVLADTTQHLNRVELVTYAGLPAVRVEAGVLIEDLLAFLEEHGYGFTATTAVGAVTLGGVMAINGHGSAVPAVGEAALPQQTYGSYPNRVLALTAVVWDPVQKAYVLKDYDRRDVDIGAMLTHLGRCFITEFTLALEPNQNLRCQSYVDISADEMFAAPGSGGRDIESFLNSAGRIETIWYPYTENPWLKVWSVSPEQPLTSRAVTAPYNYPFSDNIPDEITSLAQQMVTGDPSIAPQFGQTTYGVTVAGLAATASFDLWGPSKNTLQFIKATTIRVHEFSYAVLTRRDQVQRVIHEYTQEYLRRQQVYRDAGKYPVNMPVEYRVTGVDHAEDIGLPGAQPVTLSALHPHAGRPEWDTIVWLALLAIPGTPDAFPFFGEMEQWLLQHFDPADAIVRPEWSKGWAYQDHSAWAAPAMLDTVIPDLHRVGRSHSDNWDAAVATYKKLDPAGIFENDFLADFLS